MRRPPPTSGSAHSFPSSEQREKGIEIEPCLLQNVGQGRALHWTVTVTFRISSGNLFCSRRWLPFCRTSTHLSLCTARTMRSYDRLGTLLTPRSLARELAQRRSSST